MRFDKDKYVCVLSCCTTPVTIKDDSHQHRTSLRARKSPTLTDYLIYCPNSCKQLLRAPPNSSISMTGLSRPQCRRTRGMLADWPPSTVASTLPELLHFDSMVVILNCSRPGRSWILFYEAYFDLTGALVKVKRRSWTYMSAAAARQLQRP